MNGTVKFTCERREAIGLRVGDRALVNVAPFVGAARLQRSGVPCRVLEIDGRRMRVCPESPYRAVDLWVDDTWVQAVLPPHQIQPKRPVT